MNPVSGRSVPPAVRAPACVRTPPPTSSPGATRENIAGGPSAWEPFSTSPVSGWDLSLTPAHPPGPRLDNTSSAKRSGLGRLRGHDGTTHFLRLFPHALSPAVSQQPSSGLGETLSDKEEKLRTGPSDQAPEAEQGRGLGRSWPISPTLFSLSGCPLGWGEGNSPSLSTSHFVERHPI